LGLLSGAGLQGVVYGDGSGAQAKLRRFERDSGG
jgi:hypothetical protein